MSNKKTAQAMVYGTQISLNVSLRTIKGSTLVPLRFIAEALGIAVDWNGDEQKITLTSGQDNIVLWNGQKAAIVNGTKTTLNVTAQIIDSTTMFPCSFHQRKLKPKCAIQGC